MQHGEARRSDPRTRAPCRRGRRAPWSGCAACRPRSTLPSTTSMIGLIASAVASIALAPPMRPPFFRFSSVSSAPNTRVRDGEVGGERGDLVDVAAVGGTAGAGDGDHAEPEGHAAAVDDADRRSRRPPIVRRARRSASSPTAHPTATRRRRRSRRRPQLAGRPASNCAGRRCGGLRQRRRARAAFAQNSAVVSSTRSMNSSSPKRIVSGTISMPSSVAIDSGRSHALSVTMRTVTGRRAYPSVCSSDDDATAGSGAASSPLADGRPVESTAGAATGSTGSAPVDRLGSTSGGALARMVIACRRTVSLTPSCGGSD